MNPMQAFRARFLDVLASIYIYNEHRGYTSLDRVLEAARARCADQPEFIAEVDGALLQRADRERGDDQRGQGAPKGAAQRWGEARLGATRDHDFLLFPNNKLLADRRFATMVNES